MIAPSIFPPKQNIENLLTSLRSKHQQEVRSTGAVVAGAEQWNIGRPCMSRHVYRAVVPVLLLTTLASSLLNVLFGSHHHHHHHHATTTSDCISSERQKAILLRSSEIKVSVIIMNHARPEVLKRSTLLRTMASHPSVAQIVVLHSKPETAFNNSALIDQMEDLQLLDKLSHIDVQDMDRELGLALRFHHCAESADTDFVVIVDDDMELDQTGVNQLILEMEKNPKRIVGHYGRAFDHWDALFGHRNGYRTRTVFGDVEVVLTKIMILERRICREFGRYRDIVNDLVKESTPKWNGEDIFVNLVANRVYGVPRNGPYRNYAIPDLSVWEANTTYISKNVSISGNLDRISAKQDGPDVWQTNVRKAQAHIKYRGRLWQTAKRRLSKILIVPGE